MLGRQVKMLELIEKHAWGISVQESVHHKRIDGSGCYTANLPMSMDGSRDC
jgi:hypothetical protein